MRSPKNNKTKHQLYFRFLKKHWYLYASGAFAMILTSITEVMSPKFIQWSLDAITKQDFGRYIPNVFVSSTPAASLKLMVISLFFITLVGALGRVMWRQSLARATHMAGRMLKLEIWETLRFQSIRIFHRFPLGDLMNRSIGDLNSARFIFGFTLVITFDLLFFTSFAIVSMLYIHVGVTLLALAVLLLLPYPIARLGKKEHDFHLKAQDRLSQLSDVIAQCLNTIRMQRATASEKIWQTRLQNEADLYAKQRFKVLWTGWMIYPLGALASVVAYVALLFYGIALIQQGQLSIGQFVALQSYIFLLQRPLFDLSQCISEWQRGFASLQRINEIISLEKIDKKTPITLPQRASETAISFRHFSFRYPDAPRTLLRDLDLSIQEGEFLGLTGSIGAGKSTLLYVLSGLLSPYQGEASIYGVPLAQANREFFKQNVTFVLQKTFLFAGTIRDNLQLEHQYSDEQLWHALSIVKMDKEVQGFGDGLDAIIGEWGITLSGGQKQRLSLARALLNPKSILLLDDCLSAVDAVTEEAILANMRTLLKRTTVVWTAHRQSTLKLCNRIFELRDGHFTLATKGLECSLHP